MITVSICCQTYNHKEYIKECLDSFVNQQTKFEFEILVHDDASTDGTTDIVKEYEQKYPNLFKCVYQSENQFNKINSLTDILFKMARGKYLTVCEGDDYWCDPYKLQKQVDVLDKHTDCMVCHTWHKLGVYNPDSDNYEEKLAPKDGHGYYPEKITSVREVFKNNLRVKVRTICFRNIFKANKNVLPNWFYSVKYGDVPLSFILGQYGDFYFLDEEMAVYRQTETGVSTKGKEKSNWTFNHFWAWIDIWCYADKMYKEKYHTETINTIRGFYKRILAAYKYSSKQRLKLSYKVLFHLKQPIGQRIKDAYFCLTTLAN
jgi:glycosyltransferase involved in cell wall biosynthesis